MTDPVIDLPEQCPRMWPEHAGPPKRCDRARDHDGKHRHVQFHNLEPYGEGWTEWWWSDALDT